MFHLIKKYNNMNIFYRYRKLLSTLALCRVTTYYPLIYGLLLLLTGTVSRIYYFPFYPLKFLPYYMQCPSEWQVASSWEWLVSWSRGKCLLRISKNRACFVSRYYHGWRWRSQILPFTHLAVYKPTKRSQILTSSMHSCDFTEKASSRTSIHLLLP